MKKIGDKARLLVNTYYPKGEIVEVVEVDVNDTTPYKFTNGESDWWLAEFQLAWLENEEWTPQQGEMVQVRDNSIDSHWMTREFIATYKELHCVMVGARNVLSYDLIRQVSTINITEVKHPNLK